ncbi:hypothetical protein EJ06DRAFT_205165 [Trichodelitschia bisporula]|uniref:YCII-related domain-containing protein n=1 Tax=Trichodelitschia bisporula TaxID=703511 RepID=A0A6G1I833_9PEZI|nr:hypothetical protein EJ06DRAFT_205165 [Trichodelitschia bisporula]
MPLFMILVGNTKESEAGQHPPADRVEAMQTYSKKLAESGKLIWGEALYPTAKGARVLTDESGNTTVQKGPFEQRSVGAYSVLNADSLDEVVDIVKNHPLHTPGSGIEIREIVNLADIPLPPAEKGKVDELRALMTKNAQALRQS